MAKYKDYLGGTGLGYKVLWDEVPVGTKAWDPENRIIFGVGPLHRDGRADVGACVGDVAVPAEYGRAAGTGHMGGHWGPELKFAGWDTIIIQGKAEKPVWLRSTMTRSRFGMPASCGATASSAPRRRSRGDGRRRACGRDRPGGREHEPLVGGDVRPLALGWRRGQRDGFEEPEGDCRAAAPGSLKIAAEPEEWKELVTHFISMMGANNQHVVPRNKEPWAEFSAGTRWTGSAGRLLGRGRSAVGSGIL